MKAFDRWLLRVLAGFGMLAAAFGLLGRPAYGQDTVSTAVQGLGNPLDVTVDRHNNIYVTHNTAYLLKFDPTTGARTTLISGNYGRLQGLAVDAADNVYVAASDYKSVFRIDPSGGITLMAGRGTGQGGFFGDGGQATEAVLNAPMGVAIDSAGNIFVADTGNNRIRRVDAITGIITTVAGFGGGGYNGDNKPATSASLNQPQRVAVDADGNLYIADTYNYRIRKVDLHTGMISTVAGTGGGGYNGDNRLATTASVYEPYDVAIDPAGNLIIADTLNCRIRKVDRATGMISTMVGTGSQGFTPDGAPGYQTAITLVFGLTVAPDGALYFADYSTGMTRKLAVDATDHEIPSISRISPEGTFAGDGGGNLRVFGANFYPNGISTVRWNGMNRPTTYVSSSELSVYLDRIDLVSPGEKVLTVFNAAPGGGESLPAFFTITNPPKVNSVNPSLVFQGSPDTVITIMGEGLRGASMLSVDDPQPQFVPVRVLDDQHLEASIPAQLLDTARETGITVHVAGLSGSFRIPSVPFTVGYPIPTLERLSPDTGTAGGHGGYFMVLTGTNFNASTRVLWNNFGRPATYISATQLQIEITADDLATAGEASVKVFNTPPGGGESNELKFTILPSTDLVTAGPVPGEGKISSGPISNDFFLVSDGNGGTEWVHLADVDLHDGDIVAGQPGTNQLRIKDGAITLAKLAPDVLFGRFVSKSGDIMTGPLTLPSDPPADLLHAVTRKYVDDKDAAIYEWGTIQNNLQDAVNQQANLAQDAANVAANIALRDLLAAESNALRASDQLIHANLDAETAARKADDFNLTILLDSERHDRLVGENHLQSNLDSEALIRTIADNTLSEGLNLEGEARQAADTQLQALIDGETAARAAGDAGLYTLQADETNARVGADAALQASIDAEAAARQAAVANLTNLLNAEAAARIAADDALQANLNTEAAARAAGDNGLDATKVNRAGDTVTGNLGVQGGLTGGTLSIGGYSSLAGGVGVGSTTAELNGSMTVTLAGSRLVLTGSVKAGTSTVTLTGVTTGQIVVLRNEHAKDSATIVTGAGSARVTVAAGKTAVLLIADADSVQRVTVDCPNQ